MRIRGEELKLLKKLKTESHELLSRMGFSDLLEYMRLLGAKFNAFDLKGQWAELNEPKDIAHFVLGTKAETLFRLRDMVKLSSIENQVSFTIDCWNKNQDLWVNKVQKELICSKLVVRSSALSEDAFTHSNAGAYESILNVNNTKKEIGDAVKSVIASYDQLQSNDQVLIQPMLQDVAMCGVVFTLTFENGAPYYVINYDESGSTEGITSGTSVRNSVLYFYKDSKVEDVNCKKLRKVIRAIQEVESLLVYDALDIEFAVDINNGVHILQVRPITIKNNCSENRLDNGNTRLIQARQHFEDSQVPGTNIRGKEAIFGNMPDWNPAEIIGTNPGKLSYSLYKYLILDDIWSTQRSECGYRDVRQNSLLTSFAGKPYIDVRASFNSFLPKEVDDNLAGRLVDFYIAWLKERPHLHDKIEFEVIPTCLSFDFERWKIRLTEKGNFSESDVEIVKKGLLSVTNNVIARLDYDSDQVALLDDRLNKLMSNYKESKSDLKALLDECKVYGTLPFAHLARAGFIAVTFLKEALSKGIISQLAYDSFFSSLSTVSKSFEKEAGLVRENKLSYRKFSQKYGHLRPGTYDIMSSSYREDPDLYLKPLVDNFQHRGDEITPESEWEKEKPRFFSELCLLGIDANPQQLERFMRLAIEGREQAKFVFTRSVSLVLDKLIDWGERNDLSREVLSNLTINTLFEYTDEHTISDEKSVLLRQIANLNEQDKLASLLCELPPLISSLNDFSNFIVNEGHPNYIGSKKVTASVVVITKDSATKNLSGKVAVIPQADPGYDWLFGKDLGGLITLYGGANSHMAIRCGEFSLPAAIGIGEALYNKVCASQVIELDPKNSVMRVIR